MLPVVSLHVTRPQTDTEPLEFGSPASLRLGRDDECELRLPDDEDHRSIYADRGTPPPVRWL